MDQKCLQKIIDNVPAELKAQKIWIGFKFIPQEGKKPKKEPVNALTGGRAQSNNSKTWAPFEKVIQNASNYDAIGLALAEPYVGYDFDHSVNDGVISPKVLQVILALDSYTEFSPSKTGIHTICKGNIPRGRKFGTIDVEIYQKSRFFTITGDLVPGCKTTIED